LVGPSAIWVAAVVFKAVIKEDTYDAYRQTWYEASLAAAIEGTQFRRIVPPEFKTRSQWAEDIFRRNALVAIGAPVAVPAIVLLALWTGRGGIVVGRWVKSGFEPKGEP
jgi:hypothetical protein